MGIRNLLHKTPGSLAQLLVTQEDSDTISWGPGSQQSGFKNGTHPSPPQNNHSQPGGITLKGTGGTAAAGRDGAFHTGSQQAARGTEVVLQPPESLGTCVCLSLRAFTRGRSLTRKQELTLKTVAFWQ